MYIEQKLFYKLESSPMQVLYRNKGTILGCYLSFGNWSLLISLNLQWFNMGILKSRRNSCKQEIELI